jgi:hypothetical protein
MSNTYPRTYRMAGSTRTFYLGLGWFAAVLGLGGIGYFGFFDGGPDAGIFTTMGVLFAGLGGWLIAYAVRTRVILHENAIEAWGVVFKRRMELSEITGTRLVPREYGPPALRIDSDTPGVSHLTLPQGLRVDVEFERWFERVPNFDAQEQQASLDALLDDPELRETRSERLEKLERARKIAKQLTAVSFGVVGWAWFYPHPYNLVLAICALIPWSAVVVAARGQGLYRLNSKRNDAAADLGTPFYLPGLALMVRAVLDVSIFDWAALTGATAIATAVCLGVIRWAVPGIRSAASSLVVAALMSCYCYGVLVQTDTLLDGAMPAISRTQVMSERVSSGKTRTYELELAPWGPRKERAEVTVDRELYERTTVGDEVCVFLWPGALGIRWFAAESCPRG